MGRGVLFYATRNDLLPILEEVEVRRGLKYTLCGAFPTDALQTVNAARDIPFLGIVLKGETLLPRYLVTQSDVEVNTREASSRRGGTDFRVDQLLNERSVLLRAGGMFENQCLIGGSISTDSNHEESIKLYAAYRRWITQRFIKTKSYFLGPEALRLIDSGVRLTHSFQWSVE